MKKRIIYLLMAFSTYISILSTTVFAETTPLPEVQNTFSENIRTNGSFGTSTLLTLRNKLIKKVRYVDTLFDNYILDKDITYKTAINYLWENENLLLDVYSPDGDAKRNKAVIIWVHGGGLSMGNKDEQDWFHTIYSKSFAKKDYVTVNINYRLNPNPDSDWNGSMKNAIEDVVSAIDWIKANSKKYSIDKNNIILAG